jgi:arsenate reductase (thioredoxin)
MTKPRILFLCTGNSCRSQMAEGLLRYLSDGHLEAFSAGTDPKGLHPLAVKAMAEVQIDISKQLSKHVDALAGQSFDFVITVCDRAKEQCPVWPGAPQRLHWSFDDPAEASGSEEQRLAVFRRVRDEIRDRIRLLLISRKSSLVLPR